LGPERYGNAVDNIRETAKWLMASIGAAFVVLLAGVQINKVPFLSDPLIAGAGSVAAAGLMIALNQTVRVLVSEGLSFRELACHSAFGRERAFLNKVWTGADGDVEFKRFCEALDKADADYKAGVIAADDPTRIELNNLADELLAAATWHVSKRRFFRLKWIVVLLVPIELVAANIMASGSGRLDEKPALTITVS
jgi:hypothetical protein